uniref:G-protein coupled receptors family 1 profile domain-containing protein n=3 Tax=Romanomermis culicivorax TaxID=13658 RepID=A0A915L823_ROMCU
MDYYNQLQLTFRQFVQFRRGNLTYEFVLHLCQECCLMIIHTLIISHGMKTKNKVACKAVHVTIQYIYNTFFISVLMECLQIYCVATNVISTGSMIRMLDTCVVIFIFPLFTILPLAYYEWSTLVSSASCWINYSRPSQVYTASASLLLIWSPSVVLLEAASMGAYGALPDTDSYLKFVAR